MAFLPRAASPSAVCAGAHRLLASIPLKAEGYSTPGLPPWGAGLVAARSGLPPPGFDSCCKKGDDMDVPQTSCIGYVS